MTVNERFAALAAKRGLVKERHEEAAARLKAARESQIDIDAVQRVVQFTAARVQSNFGSYVGALVTKALHHVFPDRRRDSFVVKFRENRGKTEAQLLIVTAKGDKAHPFDCSGGGVWDTLAFALRCAMMMLEQPAPNRLLFLDEPFKFLHGASARRRAVRMMYNTFVSLGIQAIAVHQSDENAEDGIDDSLVQIQNEGGVAVYEVSKTGYEQSEVIRV